MKYLRFCKLKVNHLSIYCICSLRFFNQFQNFLEDFTNFSDHCPISYTLKCDIKMRENYKKVKGYKSVFKYIWNKDSKNKFIKVFDSQDIKTKIKNLLSSDMHYVN